MACAQEIGTGDLELNDSYNRDAMRGGSEARLPFQRMRFQQHQQLNSTFSSAAARGPITTGTTIGLHKEAMRELPFQEKLSQKEASIRHETLRLSGVTSDQNQISRAILGDKSQGQITHNSKNYNRFVHCDRKQINTNFNCEKYRNRHNHNQYNSTSNYRGYTMKSMRRPPKFRHFAAFILLLTLYHDIPVAQSAKFPNSLPTIIQQSGDSLLHSKHCSHHYPRPHEVRGKPIYFIA